MDSFTVPVGALRDSNSEYTTAACSSFFSGTLCVITCKKQPVPLQAWSGPEGSRKLRFPDFMTTAQDGGMVVSLMTRPPLSPGNTPGTHFR